MRTVEFSSLTGDLVFRYWPPYQPLSAAEHFSGFTLGYFIRCFEQMSTLLQLLLGCLEAHKHYFWTGRRGCKRMIGLRGPCRRGKDK